ncbi:3'-5' RNA helicase YTHDC2-like isoform X2 [Gouania willdenowi]|uniref:3'-5' RNA helicase YTHDC2-like isoform X2 n=1 Tax=Gouania willdenowi TaxID=441366 RepID=UPI001055FDBD|nr:3'-5' RNA helicase YTHDC2-like isoform X2 [Gouania willdenowi]
MSSDAQSRPMKEILVDEMVELGVTMALERFSCSDEKEMEFPSCYSGTERAFIHHIARDLGFISKSQGRGSKRFLTIKKRDCSEKEKLLIPLFISHNSLDCVHMLLQRFPVVKSTYSSAQPSSRSGTSAPAESERSIDHRVKAGGRLNKVIPMVPQMRTPSELDHFRRSLPVLEHQAEIVQLVRDNKVVLVVGEAGSGKTTQIPQFLLDDCSRRGEPCRIVCTQPRGLCIIAAAERVAAERGEAVGQTIGYHIRRVSRVSIKTLLTFCTTGMFLRTLMNGDASLTTITHVIMDEVHERDGLSDLLLTKMRDILHQFPTLKLVLTSAALDTELFIRYFGSCPLFYIKRRLFEVREFFLEDVLRLMDQRNINKQKEELRRQEGKRKCLNELLEAVERKPETNQGICIWNKEESLFNKLSQSGSEQLLHTTLDWCISNIFLNRDQEAFHQLYELILTEGVDVDFLHTDTGLTPLMAAASHGFLPEMEQLLKQGANMNIKASNGWTALDFAKHFNQTEAVNLLEASIPLQQLSRLDESSVLQCDSSELRLEDQETLMLYHSFSDDERVDLDLIMNLLHNICSTTSEGAVLIFLPGYEEIVALRDLLLFDDKRFSHSERYEVFTLHSDMQNMEQKEVMEASPAGIRKIILSTHIGESSITIDDVVFVIDSGKIKQKLFDSLNQASVVETVWISKASALQRKGRAGRCRPGICFRLFSRLRFNKLLNFQVPQLLQVPLQELCLQTKLLASSFCSVTEFLSKTPEPPLEQAVSSALHRLKIIGAMDQNEDLTDLGFHLVDLPLVPQLGKMVLSAVVLKCLDPILTIACMLAHRDPFVLPSQSSRRRAALLCRQNFSCSTLSDHMALLRVFQAWQKACSEGGERSFCEKNFLCQATLEMILSMRTQLLGQLRAIGFVRASGGCDIRDVNLNSNNWAVVKAALVAGMYPNLINLEQDASQLHNSTGMKVHFHPTSVLSHYTERAAQSSSNLPTDWFVYDELRRRDRTISVRCCSLVTSVTVALFAGGDKVHTVSEAESLKTADAAAADSSDSETEDLAEMGIDDQVVFQLERETGGLVFVLRQKWQSLLIRRICCPSKPWSQQDEAVIDTLVSVLEAEEHRAGLQQPAGIGRRPMLMSSDGRPPVRSSKSSVGPPNRDRSSEMLHSDLLQVNNLSKDRSPQPPSLSSAMLFNFLSPGLGFPSTRYFIMKSNNFRNIDISQKKAIWSTTPNNGSKLTKAFLETSTVLLIFSVQGSGHFQGYARMTSDISQEICPDWDQLGLGGVFSVEWIHKESLSFQNSQHLLNPWNNNNMVQISRDGQELEPQVAKQLLSLWEYPMVSE